MDPRTGDVLAMASVPTYDANNPGDAVERGSPATAPSPTATSPGSTMKTFTLAATLDAGRVSPGDRFDCQSGRPLYIGRTPHPRRPPRGGAHGGRGVPALEQHRHRQDRAPAGQAAAVRRAAALRLRAPHRHRAGRRAAGHACTRCTGGARSTSPTSPSARG